MIRIPLKQHIGSPALPVVEVDTWVNRGTLLAVPSGLGARVHSSVAGHVKQITDSDIYIQEDEIQPVDFVPIDEFSSPIEAIELAGVVGAGGAGFPAHVKLNVNLEGGMVIANGAECEPVLNHNTAYMEAHAQTVLKGLSYVVDMTGAKKGIVAVKPKHKRAIAALEKHLNDFENIGLYLLPDMYPAGDERVIVREITGVELKAGELPLTASAVVTNTETLKNITRAIDDRMPVITKDLTVGGRLKSDEHAQVYFDVPIGTRVEDLIALSGGPQICSGEIVIGGPFTGKRGSGDDVVSKTCGGVLLAVEFPEDTRKVGTIACECGADTERLREIAASMGAEIVGEEKCKRMVEAGGRYRCDLPGSCPGQTEKVLALRKKGAQIILTGTCED